MVLITPETLEKRINDLDKSDLKTLFESYWLHEWQHYEDFNQIILEMQKNREFAQQLFSHKFFISYEGTQNCNNSGKIVALRKIFHNFWFEWRGYRTANKYFIKNKDELSANTDELDIIAYKKIKELLSNQGIDVGDAEGFIYMIIAQQNDLPGNFFRYKPVLSGNISKPVAKHDSLIHTDLKKEWRIHELFSYLCSTNYQEFEKLFKP